jgi:hypothetical protein
MRSRLMGAVAGIAFSAVAILGTVERSEAVTVSWNLYCSSGCSAVDGTDGNQRTFTTNVGGLDRVLDVRAFSSTNTDGTGSFLNAFLGFYGGGLGVTSPGSTGIGGDGNGSGNAHTVDNIGRKDMIAFRFADPAYVPLSVFLSNFGDTDISAWVGGNSLAGFSDFLSLSYASLGAHGFTQYTAPNADLTSSTSSNRTANLNNSDVDLSGKYLIIAADITDTSPEDVFKIKVLTGEISNTVPEPATLLLLSVGAAGLVLLKRRTG